MVTNLSTTTDVGSLQQQVFDLRPLEVGGFRLTGRQAIPVGRPTLKGWILALQLACGAHDSSPYWIGDLMRFADSRADWKERLDQAIAATGYSHQTVLNLTYIASHVEEPERQLAPTIGHAAVVAKLPRPEQTELLSVARHEGLTVSEFRREVRSRSRRKVIEGQARLEGQFRVIYADPPWTYGNSQPSSSNAQRHYPGMTIEQLCALPVAAHALPDAVLHLWTTAPMLYENPGPREVIEAWGFTPKTQRIWNKVDHNFGHYYSVMHEILIVATRGSCTPDRPTPMLPSVVTERRGHREHSEKPESFRQDIVKQWDGPYLELFGRKKVEGWTVFGNDAALWHEEVAS
jgi:N6-adenosine-specific RNA methylase IME4